MSGETLLGPDEPSPVALHRPDGRSPILLACDHAGRRVPRRLGQLGLAESEFDRHIAWDIGVAAVSRRMSEALDATLVEQLYSRLVIDCNRPPMVPNSIPVLSEATPIPGNLDLPESDREARRREIFQPYHDAIDDTLEGRKRGGRETVLVAMHSFTPTYLGESRPWHIGTLYGRDARLARSLRDLLSGEAGLVVGDNEPYSVSDETDYTIPVHGERRGIVHVGIEIRQDLIGGEDGQAEWAERLVRLLPRALDGVEAR
ncbi:N-formylglutamate amidohydrolase [uncultured Enterovirga sp.]|uniref:N-formylglutamate amidohydrolase n=1 Tax=uncultured Enterovirga sp. TaxID=2026352 RepID=UPI0035CC527E